MLFRSKVYVSDAQTLENIYTSIELLGKITGKNDEATAMVSGMKNTFSKIENDVRLAGYGADATPRSVYFEASSWENSFWTAGSGVYMDDVAQALGLTNIFADLTLWPSVSAEQIIERNPNFIVATAMYGEESPVKEVLARQSWEGISAVKNEDVFYVDNFSIPGPRIADAAMALYKLIYENEAA